MINQEKLIRTPDEAIECIEKNRPTSGYQMLNESLDMAIAALKEQEREKWHPINPDDPDSLPDSERLVLVSFQNTERMDVARYRKNTDGGAFYPADTSLPYVSLGLFVSAWKECYCYAQGADFECAEEPFPDPLIMDESGAFTE